MVKNRLKSKLSYRILRILLIVAVGLAIILGAVHVFTSENPFLSPQEKNTEDCQEKIWCLDYDTVAMKENNCNVRTKDCTENQRCLNGECILRE